MDNYDKIKSAAQEYRAEPPASAWSKLDQKLDHDVKVQGLKKDRRKFLMMSVLTIGFVCSLIAIIFYESIKTPVPIKGQIAEWEEVEGDVNSAQLYDLDNVRILHRAMDQDAYQEYLSRLSKVSGHTYKKIGVRSS